MYEKLQKRLKNVVQQLRFPSTFFTSQLRLGKNKLECKQGDNKKQSQSAKKTFKNFSWMKELKMLTETLCSLSTLL